MTLGEDNLYKLSFKMPIGKGWIIFNDVKSQTKGDPGFELVNNGIYNYDGFVEIASIASNITKTTHIYSANGVFFINSSKEQIIRIVTLTGVAQTLKIAEGLNRIDNLPKGFYIVDGIKIIL